MVHLQQGLALFAARGDWLKLRRNGQQTVEELHLHGLHAEASQLEAYLAGNMPDIPVETAKPEADIEKSKPLLPVKCPGCGAPVRADEVDWVDEVTAECPYCGNMVRGEH
jgi:hypothetical protein